MNPKPYPESQSAPSEQSQVAESVASYVISPSAATATLAAKSRRIAGLEAPDEVWEFAQKHWLAPHLETAVRLVKESFHDIRTMSLTFAPDPEVSSLDGIIIHAKIKGSIEDWEKQYNAYVLRFVQEVPDDIRHQICLFVGSA